MRTWRGALLLYLGPWNDRVIELTGWWKLERLTHSICAVIWVSVGGCDADLDTGQSPKKSSLVAG